MDGTESREMQKAEHDNLPNCVRVKKTGSYIWDQTLNDGNGNWKRWDGTVDIDMETEGLATSAKQLPDGHNVKSNNANIATEDTLAAIKNTDGIKKITDALPAGTNTIGKVEVTNPTTNPETGLAKETTLGDVKTAVQTIDNFISGSRGLVTEDNSAAIKTAVETIDNAISGNEMQVDVVAPLPAGTNNIGDVDILTDATADPLALYQINDVDADTATKYYGYETAGGAWYIMKETTTTGDQSYRYAKGSSDYSTAWTNRATQTYNIFGTIF